MAYVLAVILRRVTGKKHDLNVGFDARRVRRDMAQMRRRSQSYIIKEAQMSASSEVSTLLCLDLMWSIWRCDASAEKASPREVPCQSDYGCLDVLNVSTT